jgi:hypothetical protein
MSRGWPYPFKPQSWVDIAHHWDDLPETFGHMAALVASIRESSAAELLVGITSMHDLVVAIAPATEPPLEVLRVYALPAPGVVRIEHQSLTGHDDLIERPAADIVSLFWRFVSYKFGIDAGPEPSQARDDSKEFGSA